MYFLWMLEGLIAKVETIPSKALLFSLLIHLNLFYLNKLAECHCIPPPSIKRGFPPPKLWVGVLQCSGSRNTISIVPLKCGSNHHQPVLQVDNSSGHSSAYVIICIHGHQYLCTCSYVLSFDLMDAQQVYSNSNSI